MRSCLRLTAVAAALLSVVPDAAALWDDRLELFVAETVTRDDNVFRLSKDASPQSDTYNTTSVGFNIDAPVSRQRFQVGTSWNQLHYNRFSNLNYLGHDGHAIWLWQAGDDLSGQLGYKETAALASFADFGGRSPDPLVTRRAFGNGSYMLTPSWQLQAGLTGQEQRNGALARQENDADLTTADLAVNYVSAASNKLGLAVQQEDGRYPHDQLLATGQLFNNGYAQRRLGVVTDWNITGKSHLAARIDRVRRDYDQLSQRDYQGTTFHALYDLKTTGKLTLSAVAQKDISPYEAIQTSIVMVKGVGLRPSFDLTDKIRLSAAADYSTRDYLGDPGTVFGTTSSRTDHVRTLAASISYRPLRSLTLLLSGQHEARTSNVPLGDYTANILTINGRFAF